MQDIADNIKNVKARIGKAAGRQNKSVDDITLVAVSKTIDVSRINEAIKTGIQHVGENRVQEARDKFPQLKGTVTRHMVGHLQRNKVKYAIKLFDMIQSVDTLALAEQINSRCAKLNKKMPILIEVNTSGEMSKYGCNPSEALTLLEAISRLPNILVKGFMTIALWSEDTEEVRSCFKQLSQIYNEAVSLPLENAQIDTLSMGMTADYELAIEEGATMVRIGTAIFGERRV